MKVIFCLYDLWIIPSYTKIFIVKQNPKVNMALKWVRFGLCYLHPIFSHFQSLFFCHFRWIFFVGNFSWIIFDGFSVENFRLMLSVGNFPWIISDGFSVRNFQWITKNPSIKIFNDLFLMNFCPSKIDS